MRSTYRVEDSLEKVYKLYKNGNARTRDEAIQTAKENRDFQFVEYIVENINDNQMVWDAFLEEAQRTCSEQNGSYIHQSKKPSI